MADARRAGVKLRLRDAGNSNEHEDRPRRRSGGVGGTGGHGGGDVSSEAWDEQLAEEEALRLTEVPDPPDYRTFQQEEVQAVADGARLLSEVERLEHALALSLPTESWHPPSLLAARDHGRQSRHHRRKSSASGPDCLRKAGNGSLAEARRGGCLNADAAEPLAGEALCRAAWTSGRLSRSSPRRSQLLSTPWRTPAIAVAGVVGGARGSHAPTAPQALPPTAFDSQSPALPPSLANELEPGQVRYVVIGGALRIDLVVPTVQPLARAGQGAQWRDGLPQALPGLALESLRQPPLTAGAELFVGVASMPEHLDLRDAARRTWMLDPLVHQGSVAVRFFVALHASARVNLEVRKEMELFGDIELLPHLDTYHLITKKTVAICTFARKVCHEKDDDSIIRVTEILLRVKNIHQGGSLLYGHLEGKFKPIRNKDKWWVSREEWPKDKYKFTWAHGPGYIFSRDIATYICDQAHSGKLRLKKSIEDVVFASWLLDYPKPVQFVNNDRFVVEGCRVFYLLAHYLSADQMLCMWKKLASGEGPLCCDD
eukprot:SM000352S13422  [mRNA]  locus=s352:10385:13234:+ [translate_table: standard]